MIACYRPVNFFQRFSVNYAPQALLALLISLWNGIFPSN